MADEQAVPELLTEGKAALAPFLEANPGTGLEVIQVGEADRLFITDPWLDPSVGLLVPQDYAAYASAINDLILPLRYSALYHRTSRQLEVIWTAYKLDENQAELVGREFTFTLEGKSHACGFRGSSEALLQISKGLAIRQVSDTDFRNLRSFSAFARRRDEDAGPSSFDQPRSFWIDDLDWVEDDVLKLVRHINFFLRYYDSQSPFVLVHPKPSGLAINPRTRYFEGFGFPNALASRELDPNLLVLWGASFGTTRSANFLNFYRIIEYVSYYYMHTEATKSIREIVKKPHLLNDLDRSTRDILLVLRNIKSQREQDAITNLIKEVVSPALVWKEIAQNKDFFTRPTEFEGELTIEALIADKSTEETFQKAGVERFASSLTKIRNALAHGKDTSSHKTILPTSHNFDLLQPWLHLIAVAAGEVVLYDAAH